MPYKSKAQMAYMHLKHPGIAKRWDKEYAVPKDLPERVKSKAKPSGKIGNIRPKSKGKKKKAKKAGRK